MPYIRIKRIKGIEYGYLVESKWDPALKSSRQAILKYLGAIQEIQPEDIPKKYLDEKMEIFLLRHSSKYHQQRERKMADLRDELLSYLLQGNRKAAGEVCEKGLDDLGVDLLYTRVVTEVMHEVGERWKKGKVTVSEEHLASNVMDEVVRKINTKITWNSKILDTVVLCTAEGEAHQLAVRVLEGLLLRRGYLTLDISASAPTESIAEFVAQWNPALVGISVTLRKNVPAALRLIGLLRQTKSRARIIVGGQGVADSGTSSFPKGVIVAEDATLATLDRLKMAGRSQKSS